MIQRYRIGPIEKRLGGSVKCRMNKDDTGGWVKWEDVEDLLSEMISGDAWEAAWKATMRFEERRILRDGLYNAD